MSAGGNSLLSLLLSLLLSITETFPSNQVARAEFLQELLSAGIEVGKATKLRRWLEGRMGLPLLSDDHLLRQYLGPLKVLEVNTLIAEFKDEFVGVYHDGTTYLGEAFCIILRCVKKDFSTVLRLVKLAFLGGSINNTQISAILMDTICQHMRVNTSNVLAFMHDSASANLLSYNDKLKHVFMYSNDNTCMPHTDNHVGEAFATLVLDEYMHLYNMAVSKKTSASLRLFAQITGKMPKQAGATRWWSSNDVQELSLLPNLLNGNLRKWAETMIEDGICPSIAPKMLTFLDHKGKVNRLTIELITVVHLGKHLKAGGTALEGDGFEYLTAYDTLIGMGDHLKSSMSSLELMSELVQVVEANGGTADASLFCERNRVRVSSAAEILRSLTNIQGVMVSINSDWWDWDGEEPPQVRYMGRIVKWHSKDQGSEQLIIAWEIGMIAGIMQQGYAPSEKADLSKASVRGGKALTESQYSFQLEPYENGAPAPTLLQQEVPVSDASPFLLTDPDFSKMDVVKAYAHTIVAPAIDYWIKTIDVKKGDEVAHFKEARTFNPLHVMVNKISVADIDNLNLFRLSEHPQIGTHIQGMKSEINTYHVLVQSIKSLDERKDVKGKDTFSLPEWWRCNSGNLPHFAFVLRSLLTNAPNSCPPERLFSMFNATFGEDQKRAFGDYLELAMQSQYNKRNL
jgi:hypothetical protein